MATDCFEISWLRSNANKNGWSEIFFNKQSRVISFKRGGCRLNVYYTTGTVGTCLDHPFQGKTQLFRVKVNKDLLLKIFVDPRTHTSRGYKKREDASRSVPYDEEAPTEKSALQRRLCELQEERGDLDQKISTIQQELQKIEDLERREREEMERKRIANKKGNQFTYHLFSEDPEFVDEEFSSSVTSIAISSSGAICMIYQDGSASWSPGLPTGLYNQLNSRNPRLPKPHIVAMGSYESWFVQFEDGSFRSEGIPNGLRDYFEDFSGELIEQISFADENYWIKTSSGDIDFMLPSEAANLANGRATNRDPSTATIDWISLGMEDGYETYYIRFEDGAAQWNVGASFDDDGQSLLKDVILSAERGWIARW